jgi:hypothetical protein
LCDGVDAVDIKARIGFGVAELLRLGEHLGEVAAAFAHRRQDVVRRAVEDAVDARQTVAGKPLAQRLDDRNAAGDRCLESERHASRLGGLGKLGAMLGHQGLVCGDDVFAAGERRLDDLARHSVSAADQLDDDLDFGNRGQRQGVFAPACARQVDPAVAVPIARRNRGNDNAPGRRAPTATRPGAAGVARSRRRRCRARRRRS